MLIDSFKSSLLESLEAKLLLHVIDANDPRLLEKVAVVETILENLSAAQPMIVVLNKVDLIDDTALTAIQTELIEFYSKKERTLKDVIFISARTGKAVWTLIEKIEAFFT